MKCRACGAVAELLEWPVGRPPVCPQCGAFLSPTAGDRTVVAGDGLAPSTLGDGPPPTRVEMPDAGESFAGYEIVELLGRGGMGAVYRARRPGSARDIALKVLLGGKGASEEEIARFRREAQVVADLRHPGIVAVHDAGEADGCPFFTMDLVPGPSLARRLRESGPLAPRAAIEIVRDLARALEHAHAQGIVHRDLKPANVLLAEGTRPVLTDFGIARKLGAATRLTRTGAILGTPAYMSPEQADGDVSVSIAGVGPPSDVYSLGVILYECLTGRVPFDGATEIQIVYQVLSKEPERPSRWVTDLPADVETICLKAMDKEIARRYASAGALADDAERWLRGEAIAARPLTRGERFARLLRRRKREAVAVLAGMFVAAVASAWGFASVREAARLEAERQAAAQAFQAGMRLYTTRRFEDALAKFEEALRADPTMETAQLNRAQLLRELGRKKEGRAALEAAVAACPRSSSAVHQLGSELFDEGKYEEAARCFTRAIELEPDHAMAFMNRGYCYVKLGKLDLAEPDLDAAIRLDDRYAEAYLRRGILRRERKDWEKAKQDHNRAIELNPDAAENWYQRAKLLSDHGVPDDVMRDTAEALRLGMNTADVHLVRAQALHAKKQLGEALDELQKGIDLDPRHAPSLAQAGFVLNDLGKPEKAVEVLERALKIDANNVSAWINLGNARLLLDRFEPAVECYDHALTLRPVDAEALSNRAMAHLRLGHGIPAKTDAEAAIQANPKLGAPHAVLGLALAKEGKNAEAMAEYDAALALGLPGFTEQIEEARTQVVLALGNLADAQADFERKCARNPRDGAAWYGKGWVEARTGRHADAAEDFARAREAGYDPQGMTTLAHAAALAQSGRAEAGLAEVDAVIAKTPADAAALQARGVILMRLERWAEADAALARLMELQPSSPDGPYNRACVAARSGRAEDALGWLEKAVALGMKDADAVEKDADLERVRESARFREIVEKMRQGE